MRTIGKLVKEARLRKKVSIARLEDETKIKNEFLEAIENEEWAVLPDLPVIAGFVKTIAGFLGLNQNQLAAILRRDYPPQKLSVNPKPDVTDAFTWTPKFTFYVGAGVIAVFILGYLVFQYTKFVKPPGLSVSYPLDGTQVTTSKVKVQGKTDPEATIKVNNQPVLVDEDGTFSVEIQIYQGTTEIVIKSASRTGKETIIRRTINPSL